jgi:peptidoglycan/xylan/chitin deacetylase (PgdA/CDA1 family)
MAAMPNLFVTTSWDDDDRTGLKLAELLSQHGLRGTFYVPTGRLGGDSLFSRGDLRTLSASGFEIGGHTVSHAILPNVDSQQRDREITECKAVLEEIVGTEIGMFCYPKGRRNREVESAVRRAGYIGARSTEMLTTRAAFDPFAMPATIQAYPHRPSNYVRGLLRIGAFQTLMRATPDLLTFDNWLELGKKQFDRVLRNGGVWHLYGHSWEIEKLNLWAQVREMFAYVGNRGGVQYVTNGQFVGSMKGEAKVDDGGDKTSTQSVIHQ